MSEFDFDEVLGSLEKGPVDDSFREQLLSRSQKTLVRGRVKRRIVKAGGIFSCILIIAVGAFLCGRFSGDNPGREIHVAIGDENVVVSAELVAWLDAGRFFEQIGMPERATKAYKYASKLIPVENAEPQALASTETTQLASLLQRAEAAAIENERMNSPEPGNCMLATITISK
jgi:hypothetical protein